MFDRFLTYARARRALNAGQFETALRLLRDPAIARERRAVQLAERALGGMLKRARRRADAGNVDAARVDVQLVLDDSPEFDGAATLRTELDSAAIAERERLAAAADLRREARSRAEKGDLHAARQLCDEAAAAQPESAEQAALTRFVESREGARAADLQELQAAVDSADVKALRRLLARLRVGELPADMRGVQARATEVAGEHFARLLRDTDDPGAILDELFADRCVFEGLVENADVAAALDRHAAVLAADLDRLLREGELAAAVDRAGDIHSLLAGRGPLAVPGAGVGCLREALSCEARGDLGRALEQMHAAADALGHSAVRAAAERLARAEREAAKALEEARSIAAEGRLLAARETLAGVLETWPTHEPLRREMDIFNRQAEERETRLQQARSLALEARLAAASGLLLSLAGDTEEGREARLLLKDVQRRMDLAAKGLSQVRRAVHGQGSANAEGLRHCIARLDEVAKLQADLDEIDTLRAALTSELEALQALDRAARGVDAGDGETVGSALSQFASRRGALLHPDRLQARFLEVADRVLQRAETDLHNARLTGAGAWLAHLRAHGDDPALRSRIEALGDALTTGQGKAEAILGRLDQTTGSGSFEDSAELLDAARTVWADCPQIAKLEARVVAMQQHSQSADEVERLTGTGDVRGAQRRLGEMPPTPGFLRTRIFDIKQGLAKAQGLERGFLMRVDEGGEYLVVRHDSITFGNIREHKADVQVLANISGLHARIRRSMSFHGGMEDRIVAEKGDVFVNGRKVDSAVMKSGDRVRLGATFEFVYRVVGKRSLTVLLELKSGFQVAGADKILLMKDRGRDGRLLIGRADDAHVRLPHDESEVEVYSASDGQVRVRFGGKGEIDGRPFNGEHPVQAGAWVRCGATSFVLQPWS